MRTFSLFIACLLFLSCSEKQVLPPGSSNTRTYRMGLQNSAPRYNDFNLVVQSLNMWIDHADAAMITTEVPWDSLLAGKKIVKYVINNYAGLVNFYRSKNLKLWVYIDPANGLNRSADATALVAAGKSIVQPDVQMIYRRFVVVMDSILKPEHLGLALETNLIRYASSPSLYQGVREAANAAAADVRLFDKVVKLSFSVQADVAWGKLQGSNTYAGIAGDLADFPFAQELGISSYPYFNFASPADIPDTYYSRLAEGTGLPLFVTEGGWSSKKSDPVLKCTCSDQQQVDYIIRQGVLLDKAQATGYFQLTFTDIDLSALPANVDPTIRYFAYLGFVDVKLQPKSSWNEWQKLFLKTLH